jgi:DNA-binding IscR family transcriptional regulator
MPFRVLVHLAQCADRSGAATVTLPGVAAACGTTEVITRHSLLELSAAGLVNVTLDGERAHVPLTTEDAQGALFVPA